MNVQNTSKWVKRAIALAVTAAAAGAFFGWPTKSILEIQPSASWKFLALLALTPVVGRFFCECLCPLGALQSFVNWLFLWHTVCSIFLDTIMKTRKRQR